MKKEHKASMEICGTLEQQSLPEIMRRIYTERRTGELLVIKDNVRRRVFFELGRPTFATSNRRGDRLGSFLLRRGDISQTVFKMVDGMVPRGQRFGQMLVEMGMLTAEQLTRAVHEQILMIIYSLFESTKGDYEFTARATTSVPPDLKLDLSMADIMLEGVGRIRDLAVVRRGMGDLNRLIAPSADPLLRLQQASLRQPEQDLLSQITQPTDLLSVLVFSPHPSAETIRALYGLLCAGFLTWAPTRTEAPLPVAAVADKYAATVSATGEVIATPQPLNATVTPQPEAALLKTSADNATAEATEPDLMIELVTENPPPAIQSAVSSAATISGQAPEPKNSEDELRREVAALRQRIQTGDLRAVFGFGQQAEIEQIRAAYHELLRRFHPDKFRQASKSLREEVEEVFKSINEAWQQIQNAAPQNSQPSSPDLATASISLGNANAAQADIAPGEEIRSADKLSAKELMDIAKVSYRNGVSALMSKKYGEAMTLLQRAVSINPGHAMYHSALALALASNSQRSSPQTSKEAEQHYLEAIRLEPEEPYHHAMLGMLYARLGMARRAESVYRQALRIDPRYEIALKGLAAKPMAAEVLMSLMARV
jgi:tetratricopeptide (TPR) repeat protein